MLNLNPDVKSKPWRAAFISVNGVGGAMWSETLTNQTKALPLTNQTKARRQPHLHILENI